MAVKKYYGMNARPLIKKIKEGRLRLSTLKKILEHEKKNKNRKTVLNALNDEIKNKTKKKIRKNIKKTSKKAEKSIKKFRGGLAFYIQEAEGGTVNVAESVKELAEKLDKASDEVFKHHLRPGANDFADWVKNIVKNKSLAKKLRKVKLERGVKKARKKILKILK